MTAARSGALGAPPWLVWAALLVVYLVWGSTYLGIRVVVESMPPLLTAGLRFVIAGGILMTALAARSGAAKLHISKGELVAAGLVGISLLTIANGLVTVGEKTVPSGLAALIIGVVPLVILVLRRLSGERISKAGVGGVALGFAGLGVLVVPRGLSGAADPVGMGMLVVASTSWAIGSFMSRRLSLPQDGLVATGYQLSIGGACLLLAGVATGELPQAQAGGFSEASIWALLYLILFGSLLAYTAYVWLLRNAPVTKVATYAYVNPIVALALGGLILDERLDASMIIGALMIVASVGFIVRTESGPALRDAAIKSAPIPPLRGRADLMARLRR